MTDANYALVEFRGQKLLTMVDGDTIRVAMRPVVEALGLDWPSQYRRINNDLLLSEGVVMMTTPSERGAQKTLTLPLDLLHGWLFTLDISRVKESARETIVAYQRECYQVLRDYWTKGMAVNPRATAQLELADRAARRRDLPGLLDRLLKTRNREIRRVLGALITKACVAEEIAPPDLDAIGSADPDVCEIVAPFFAALDQLTALGVAWNHHRDPRLIAVNPTEAKALFARHHQPVRIDRRLTEALRQSTTPRFVTVGPVNSRTGGTRTVTKHCYVFERGRDQPLLT